MRISRPHFEPEDSRGMFLVSVVELALLFNSILWCGSQCSCSALLINSRVIPHSVRQRVALEQERASCLNAAPIRMSTSPSSLQGIHECIRQVDSREDAEAIVDK